MIFLIFIYSIRYPRSMESFYLQTYTNFTYNYTYYPPSGYKPFKGSYSSVHSIALFTLLFIYFILLLSLLFSFSFQSLKFSSNNFLIFFLFFFTYTIASWNYYLIFIDFLAYIICVCCVCVFIYYFWNLVIFFISCVTVFCF